MPLHVGKNKKVIGWMKEEEGGKTITKPAAPRAKAYTHEVQNYNHKIKDPQLKNTKEVKKSASNELECNDFGKSFHDITNTPITKKN